MNPLDLNLASRPIRNNTLLWVAHAAIAVVILGGTSWNVTAYVRHGRDLQVLNAERDSFESRMSDLQRRENAARRGIAKHDLNDLNLRASKASDVIERKALSWTRLFNRMEEVLPYEVRMVTIRPVFSFGRREQQGRDTHPAGSIPVSVEGTAKTLEAFFEFERALIHDPHFNQIEPHRFHRGEASEVVFEMRFLYFPDAETHEPSVPEQEQAASQAVADGAVELPEIVEEPPPADGIEVIDEGPVAATEEPTEVIVADDGPPQTASPVRKGPATKGRRSGRRGQDPTRRAVRPEMPGKGRAEAQAPDEIQPDSSAGTEAAQDSETEGEQGP